MPFGDGTGPAWNYGRGYRYSRGVGHGYGCRTADWGYRAHMPYAPSVEDEKYYLEAQEHWLEEELKYVKDRLDLLGKKES